jgi:hypothetical protein
MIKIEIKEWSRTCDGGCCYTYGTDVFMDGVQVNESDVSEKEELLIAVLKHLGIEAEIVIEYQDMDAYIEQDGE